MTCEKHCLHWEVCKLTPPEYATAKYYTFCNCAEKCECFKDKSKYIELPCKVGDTVYSYCYEFGYILPYFVENINIGFLANDRTFISFEANSHADETDELLDDIDFDLEDIGKTVFLTKETAEQKLKELLGDN